MFCTKFWNSLFFDEAHTKTRYETLLKWNPNRNSKVFVIQIILCYDENRNTGLFENSLLINKLFIYCLGSQSTLKPWFIIRLITYRYDNNFVYVPKRTIIGCRRVRYLQTPVVQIQFLTSSFLIVFYFTLDIVDFPEIKICPFSVSSHTVKFLEVLNTNRILKWKQVNRVRFSWLQPRSQDFSLAPRKI